jgi:hypothetical protein
VGPKATHNLASLNSNPIIIGDQITGFGELPCLDIFSCRHRGETVREDFIFLSPAPGDMPHLNFFFFIANLANLDTHKTYIFARLEVNLIFSANLAKFRHL